MNSTVTASMVFGILFCSALLGVLLRRRLPEQHLTADAKDTVKLSMGLVASMTALVLGLLVASAKGSYDTQRTEVIQLAAKTAFLNRVLTVYGPDSAEAREKLQKVVDSAVARLWLDADLPKELREPTVEPGKVLYEAVQKLQPQTDAQRALKGQASQQIMELGQLRWLLFEQSGSSVSRPLLIIVISWLTFIFLSFGVFAPGNTVTVSALMIAALSVAGSIFLILELDRPFGGFIQIPSEIISQALTRAGN